MSKQICSKCREDKPKSHYNKWSKICLDCRRIKQEKYYSERVEKVKNIDFIIDKLDKVTREKEYLVKNIATMTGASNNMMTVLTISIVVTITNTILLGISLLMFFF